jgi:branched-chain amino acid transport system ATP-binding protein
MFDVLEQLNQERGMTILLVEQNASLALSLSHRAYVLETGNISLEGRGADLLESPRIQESYLGISH